MRLLSPDDPLLQPAGQLVSSLDTSGKLVVATLFAISAVALFLPPYYGYRFDGNFWSAMFGTNDAMTCLSVDVIIAATAFLLWTFYDMQQLQLSLVTFLGLCAGLAIALALPIPVYLAARIVRQANLAVAQQLGQVSNPSGGGASSLLPPARMSLFCPLAIIAALGLAMQIVFLTNAGDIRDKS